MQVPLVFYYGHASPTENPELYRHLVEQLAQLLDRREALNAEARPPHCSAFPRPCQRSSLPGRSAARCGLQHTLLAASACRCAQLPMQPRLQQIC